MKWKMIVAMDDSRVIGLNDRLPWRIPEDIAWYQSQTDGKLLLMGRKTFDSIRRRPEGTRYIVLSQSMDPEMHDSETVTVIKDIGELCSLNLEGEGWVCGGAMLYELMMPFCAEMVLSEVKGTHEGDAFFPKFDEWYQWSQTLKVHPEFTVNQYINPSYDENKFVNYCQTNRVAHIDTREPNLITETLSNKEAIK